MSVELYPSSLTQEERIAQRLHKRFLNFMELEVSSGLLMMAMAVIAILWANISPHSYHAFFDEPLSHIFGLNGFTLGHGGHMMLVFDLTLKTFINDILMVFFFFVVGTEIKREMVMGGLRTFQDASLPVMAAIGGMVAPAAVYLIFHHDTNYTSGWGVPMATDIAFAVGVLSLLGNRIPSNLKVFLLALAIVDDLGAILVIAIGYTEHLNLSALVAAFVMIFVVVGFRTMGVRRIWVYFFLGFWLWLFVYLSGVHATIAGVLLGFLTPSNPYHGEEGFLAQADHWLKEFQHAKNTNADGHVKSMILEGLNWARQGAISPLHYLESIFAPYTAFFIIPLFALANAGVEIHTDALTGDSASTGYVALAVLAGLVLGKPIGVVLFSWLAVKLKISKLPGGSNWTMMTGIGVMAGIGFTMAIFVAELAFKSDLVRSALPIAKIGIMSASVIAAIAGLIFLSIAVRRPPRQH